MSVFGDLYDLGQSKGELQEYRYPTIKVIENGYVKEIRYCSNCGSINVGESKKGNIYCKELCWK